MEEEHFFYYLTHGVQSGCDHNNERKWDYQNGTGHTAPNENYNFNDDEEEAETAAAVVGSSNVFPPSEVNCSRLTQRLQGLLGLDSKLAVPTTSISTSASNSSAVASTLPASLHTSSVRQTSLSEKIRLLPPKNGKTNYYHNCTYSVESSNHSSINNNNNNNNNNQNINGSVLSLPSLGLERKDSFFKPLSRKNSSFFVPLTRRASTFVEPFNDHHGKPKSVAQGLFNLTIVGTIIGILMPQNEELPTSWYRLCSSIIGYSYFTFWCVSFYPQVVMNFQRKSTEGLSIDYTVLNFFGCFCYTAYTLMLYWNKAVREMYIERYIKDNPNGPQPEITVESNDIAYAINALIMSLIWIIQLQIYGGFRQCREEGKRIISKPMTIFMQLIIGSCTAYAALIGYFELFPNNILFFSYTTLQWLNWLDFLYYVAYMKVIMTVAKYIPQYILNRQRQSCVGWNIWNVLLDFFGGFLSLVQLIGDAIDLNDFSSITGNSAKLALSAVSILFDTMFLLQHYVWYPEKDEHQHIISQQDHRRILIPPKKAQYDELV